MNVSNIIEEIINTGSKGKELLMESFIVGLAWGRGDLQKEQDLKKAIQQLVSLNQQINNSQVSSFSKLDQFNEYLSNKLQLFKISKLFTFSNNNQLSTPQKQLQQGQQTPQKQKNKQSQNRDNQTSKLCQICHFIIDESPNQFSTLSDCLHEFHSLCLYIHSQQIGFNCPICKNQLAQDYIELLYERLPQQYKSCCPNIQCQNSFLYYGQQIFDCQLCETQWCLKCKRQYQKNHNCTLEVDHFYMQMGYKYKFCPKSQKIQFFHILPKVAEKC